MKLLSACVFALYSLVQTGCLSHVTTAAPGDTQRDARTQTFSLLAVLQTKFFHVLSVSLSPKGGAVVACGTLAPPEVFILGQARKRRVLIGATNDAFSCGWSSNGKSIWVVEPKRFLIFDAATLKLKRRILIGETNTKFLAASPSLDRIATETYGLVEIINIGSSRVSRTPVLTAAKAVKSGFFLGEDAFYLVEADRLVEFTIDQAGANKVESEIRCVLALPVGKNFLLIVNEGVVSLTNPNTRSAVWSKHFSDLSDMYLAAEVGTSKAIATIELNGRPYGVLNCRRVKDGEFLCSKRMDLPVTSLSVSTLSNRIAVGELRSGRVILYELK